MLSDEVLVDGHAEAGAVRHRDMPVLDERPFVDDAVPDRVVEVMEFEDEEVGDGRADMAGGDRFDGAADVVRGQGNVVHIGQVGDTSAFEQAARFRQVGRDDVGGLALD